MMNFILGKLEKRVKEVERRKRISLSLKNYHAVKRAEKGYHRVQYTEMGVYKGYYLLPNKY